MMVLLRDVRRTSRTWPAFSLLVLIALAAAGIIGLMVVVMQLQPGFMGMAHFTEPHHRVHDLTFGFLFATGVIGLLAQLRRPMENVAGLSMALVPWIALALVALLSGSGLVFLSAQTVSVAALTLIAALLHPTGRDFFRSFGRSRISWSLLALVLIAAVPLLAFAAANISLQASAANDHATLGHYGFMAAFGLTVVVVGLLSSVRPVGWRLTAWVAGLLPALFGVISMVYPDVDSSLDPFWAIPSIAWGVAFVVAAEFIRRASSDTQIDELAAYPEPGSDSGGEPRRRSITGTRRWVYALAGIVIVSVVLFVILHLTGGSFGGH